MSEENGVVITLREMYSDVRSMRSDIEGMRSDLRAALQSNEDHEKRLRNLEGSVRELESAQDAQVDHGPRLRSLETKVVFATGSAAVLGALASAVLTDLTKAVVGG